MSPNLCVPTLLLSLPDDIFTTITTSLSPKDVINLSLTSRDLNTILSFDKLWFAQCDKLRAITTDSLIEWREGVHSYKSICRFLISIQPLLGIWVHQNPELGNVVYVIPGFLSIVACRITPQEVGPLGLEKGPILWAPVFEILCDYDGTPSFFLHGRERGNDYLYPGSIKSVDKACNVLLLEVEPNSKSFCSEVEDEGSRRLCKSNKGTVMPFSRLGFGDRRRLLDIVTSRVRLSVPDSKNGLLFPSLRNDVSFLHERRSNLLQMYENHDQVSCSELPFNREVLGSNDVRIDGTRTRGKSLSGFLKNGLKQILGKSRNGINENLKKNTSSKHANLQLFLQSGDNIGLSLRATTMKLSSYRAWPNMHENRFALYKLPILAPKSNHEFSGLWGGTFGWPPSNEKPGKDRKALFLISISYEESDGQDLLIATKILEGTSYVLHPNGSAMFIANMNQLSFDIFPYDIDVKRAFFGEGISNGYGFRYPGSKPGSLFVMGNGLLVFVWKESRAILSLQRLDLTDLLKRGERVAALSPILNFAYLTKTYSNVFSGFSNSSSGVA